MTHVLVIALVVVTCGGALAIGQAVPNATEAARFDLVSRARAAAETVAALPPTTYELVPEPEAADDHVPIDRGSYVIVEPTPLPTPVAPPPAPVVVAAAQPAPKPQTVSGNGQLAWPVAGGTITTYYSSAHLALDIAAPAGSAVTAADDGIVTFAGWRNNGGGLVVVINHGDGVVTAYNHLGVISVAAGESVGRGGRIASVGCTGMCTGPHVHFEVIVGGVIVNPLRYL